MMNRLLLSILWMVLAIASLPSVLAAESDWPRTLPLEQGMMTIYSLQVDELRKNTIHFRAALAYRATAGAEPVFGAAWFESPVEIDSSSRIVHPTDLKVTETRFPDGTADVQSELADALAQHSYSWNLDFSLDELEAALITAESGTGENLNTAPPQIIYRDHPALLISMDGVPVLREIENSPLEAVINTPYPLIFDQRYYYLNAAKDVWYRADSATGPYRFDTNPPADIVAMVKADDAEELDEQVTGTVTAANAPEIIISTEPAELIVTEGPAAFVPLVDDLLVLQNSDDDVFMHVSSQKYYIVLAGRWYYASSLNGPWDFRLADDLPTAFANIPKDSDQADSRVYVAGTEEARDAVLDSYVPQTAAVNRGEVDIEVKYDGEPVYAPLDGTGLVYIENTGSSVIKADGLYYLVEDGVWYVAPSPNGAWQVSDHRPQQVDTILPTSPLYNVRYVNVYDSTPNVVYVGYTPGYMGSYVYRNTIFYGTGWYYRPWVSPYYYYPRYSTWGFHAGYSYWGGWSFGLSWGWGPFSVGYYPGGYWHHNHYWHHRHHGHWGPRGYRHRPGHHNKGHKRYGHNNYRRGGDDGYGRDGRRGNDHRRGDYDGYAINDRRSNPRERNDNLYRDRSQRAGIADTRDNRPRKQGNRNNDARRANYSVARADRQQNYTGLKKAERHRTEPINSSDLRKKANVRDANRNANLDRLLADNSGNVYRKAGRKSDTYNTVAQKGKTSGNGEKYRAAKPPAQNGSNSRKARQRADVTIYSTAKYSQPKERNNNRQKNSAAVTAPRQQSRNKSRDTASQRVPRTVSGSTQKQVRVRSNQSSAATVNTRNQRSQQKSPNNTRQHASRVVSAPTRKQSRSRTEPAPKRSTNSGRSNPAPASSKPPRNSGKASQQRSSSNSQKGNSRRSGRR